MSSFASDVSALLVPTFRTAPRLVLCASLICGENQKSHLLLSIRGRSNMKLFDSRSSQERKQLSLAKKKQKEEQHAFKQMLDMQRSKTREDLANQRAESTQKVLAQKTAETQAKQKLYEARKAYGDRRLAVFKGNVTRTVEAVKPYTAPVKAVYNVGKSALTTIAHSGIEKYYVMGYSKGDSPSYTILMQAFEGQPFTPSQAVQVLASARGIDYNDAYRRLVQMKQLGMIKVGGV